jgi:hypothetical protein
VNLKSEGSVLGDRTLAEDSKDVARQSVKATLSLPHTANGLEQTQGDSHLLLNALKCGSGKHAERRVFKSLLFQGHYLIAFRPRVLLQPAIVWLDLNPHAELSVFDNQYS